MTVVMVAFASLGLAACDATEQTGDDLDNVQVGGLDNKADSLFYPSEMGELQLLTPQTQNLVARTSGYQVYTFKGRANADTTFVMKSGQFRTYMRVYAPSGRRWSRSGVRNADNGAYYSTLDVTLPESGTYTVLATSYDNMRYYPYARTNGEYTLSADGQWFCGGLAPSAFPCPSYLKCLYNGTYPDAGGVCALQTACHTAADCDGLIHPACWIGPNGGWKCNAEGRDSTIGSCGYVCGNPTDRTPASGQCVRNGGEACASDADCTIGGCGNEYCGAAGAITTCDCTQPQGVSCGCVAGHCSWYN